MLSVAVTLVATAVILMGYTAYRQLRFGLKFRPPGLIDIDELSDIELSLNDGDDVFVVCHCIEDPTDTLRDAVIENFSEGVKYHFVVSESQHRSQLSKFEGYFRALETIARMEARSTPRDGSLFEIDCLPYEWDDVPYIFYRYHGENGEAPAFKVFRGNQSKEGIAEGYFQVDRMTAYTLAQSIVKSITAFAGLGNELGKYAQEGLQNNVDYSLMKKTA